MQQPSQLQRIKELAHSREQALAQEVSELTQREESEKATLTRLDAYLDEYSRAGFSGKCQVNDLDNERRFVQRLDKAVRQQRVQVERMVERTLEATQRWYRARAEVEVLSRLIESREETRQRELRRRLQRDADSRATLRRTHLPEVFQ